MVNIDNYLEILPKSSKLRGIIDSAAYIDIDPYNKG